MQNTINYGWPYPDPSDHTRTWEYWATYTAIDASLKSVESKADANTAAVSRFRAYVPASFTLAFPGGTTNSASQTITFPANRFTLTPAMTAICLGTLASFRTSQMSAVSCGLVAVSTNTASSSAGTQFGAFQAIEATASEILALTDDPCGPDPGVDPDFGQPVCSLATCHTEGCGNGEIPIGVWVYDGWPPVMCGVCMQPIADVVPVA